MGGIVEIVKTKKFDHCHFVVLARIVIHGVMSSEAAERTIKSRNVTSRLLYYSVLGMITGILKTSKFGHCYRIMHIVYFTRIFHGAVTRTFM